MKILIVVPDFPLNPENIKGGVNSALANLLKGFANFDISIRVITFNREISEIFIAEYSKNTHIYYFPEAKLPHVFNFAFKGGAILKAQIKEFNPLIVHYGMSGYILLTKLLGLRHTIQMVTIHGIPFLEAKQKKTFKEKLVFYTNGFVEMLLCPKNIIHLSDYSQNQYAAKNSNFTLIPNATNPEFLSLPLKNIAQNKLLFVGSVETRKNILFILKLLKALTEKKIFFSLEVVGDFTDALYKNEVLSFIKHNELEKYIHFHGWKSQRELLGIMANVDILFVASKQETMPMAIAEAMSAGKVVVSAAVGGIPEMITDKEDGFLFHSFTVDAVLPILEQLYNNDAMVTKLGIKARDTARATFHCTKVAQKTMGFYSSLHKNSSHLN
jgi:glycosyltransferase involved in cell wall biosynthesis